MLEKYISYHISHGHAVSFQKLGWGVQTVLLEEAPFVGIVEEEGEGPVGYDGRNGDEVFVFDEGE